MNNQELENTTTTTFYCPQCGHEIVIRHIRHEIDSDMPDLMDETRAKLLRQQFGKMVTATERAAVQLARPWKVACAVLTVVTALTAIKRRGI